MASAHEQRVGVRAAGAGARWVLAPSLPTRYAATVSPTLSPDGYWPLLEGEPDQGLALGQPGRPSVIMLADQRRSPLPGWSWPCSPSSSAALLQRTKSTPGSPPPSPSSSRVGDGLAGRHVRGDPYDVDPSPARSTITVAPSAPIRMSSTASAASAGLRSRPAEGSRSPTGPAGPDPLWLPAPARSWTFTPPLPRALRTDKIGHSPTVLK